MRFLHAVDSFALNNHGLLTPKAVIRAGFSRSTWYRAIDSQVIELIHPGVARMYGSERTRHQLIAAAVLAAGPHAMASHASSAFLHGVPRPDRDLVDIILTERSRQATLEGVRVHRPRDHRDLSPVRRANIPCCVICRWLCDLGVIDPEGLSEAVGHVLFADLIKLTDIFAAIAVHARQGRAGVPALRAALDEWLIDDKVADSLLEKAMRELAEKYHLPPMQFHAIVEGYEVDFHILDTPIVLECDGWGTHGRVRSQFERDRARDAELTERGYITVRFTYRRLTRDPAWVAARIQGAVDRWRPASA